MKQESIKNANKIKLIYVYDALCGWCYGFSSVINQFAEKYENDLIFEVISGGMVTGGRIGPIGEVVGYISWAYKDVENATGIKFGNNFLNKTLKDGKAIFTSIPPAIAMSVFKDLQPNSSIKFANELQKGFYFEGFEPEKYENYGEIAQKFNLDKDDFILKMNDPIYINLANLDFEKSNQLNVSGFPSVYIEINKIYYKISSGYVPFKTLEDNYLTLIKN